VKPALLLYCQHSVGLGHLMRSYALSAALAERFRVVLLCGGAVPAGIRPPAGVRVVALPPLGIGAGGRFVSHDPRYTLEAAWAARHARILATFRALRPAAVVVELFPFGRAKFARELVPLLEAARSAGALTACSVRDILVSRRADQQEHDDRAARYADALLDAVLVHSDPSFARLEETFAPRRPLRVPVHYTGFVVREPLSLMQGPALRSRVDGTAVRVATDADLDAANALCQRIHGHTRAGELRVALGQGTASVVERDGRLTGYTTGIGFFGHAVGETMQDVEALIGAADAFAGPGFLVPTRDAPLMRWCLQSGLRVVQPMTLMTMGPYTEPRGAFLPSILY